jgi:hypothetical protein
MKDGAGKHYLETAVDPGMNDVVAVAYSDQRPIKSVSTSEFNDRAGYNISKRRVNRWNKEMEELSTTVPSSKVADMPSFEAHIRGYLAVLPLLLHHRALKGYRSMRFFRYQGKQKAIEHVCDVVAPKDKLVVVGFGNWNNNGAGISRKCSGPVKEIRHCLSRRRNVLFKNIDEYKTSCTCHKCFNRLVNMKAASVRVKITKEGKREKELVQGNKVHKVLHCRNSVGSAPEEGRCGTTWNRDANAAQNLLLLLQVWMRGEERPEVFCKPHRNTIPCEAIVSCGANFWSRKDRVDETSVIHEAFIQLKRYGMKSSKEKARCS